MQNWPIHWEICCREPVQNPKQIAPKFNRKLFDELAKLDITKKLMISIDDLSGISTIQRTIETCN
jgi:hypothetical protein